jgi:molybdopterin converting factor small subunit
MLPEKPAVAINQTYSFLDEPLTAGDEVAFIPPVAGG